jgi:predicted Zn-dependent protease
VADWRHLPDEELARRGREQLRHGHYALASEMLSTYCSRMIAQDRGIGAPVMAGYGLAIGMTGDLEEGLAMCQRALSTDRRNADIWAALARLLLLSGDRKKTFDAVARGLGLAPRHTELLGLRRSLGVRRRPAVPFLTRGNRLNVRLGRMLSRLVGGAKKLA